MINRDVGDPLLKISYGIASYFHDFADEVISVPHRTLWIIHKRCLTAVPPVGESRPSHPDQWSDTEALDVFFSIDQQRLGFAAVPSFSQHSIVFRTKHHPKLSGFPPFVVEP